MRRRLSWSSVVLTLAAASAAAMLASCAGAATSGGQGGNAGSSTSKITPTINWPTPSPITNSTPLGSTQLDATANVPGSFVYNPPAGTVLDAGAQTLTVVFTPSNPAAYNTAQASVSLTVNSATPASPDAYVYVSASSTSNSNAVETYAFAAASDGTLTPVSGSPFVSTGGLQTTNGKYLFGTDGTYLYSYSTTADGSFQQAASIDAQQFNTQINGGTPCGGPDILFFDQIGDTLYDLDFYSDCANNAYQSFRVDNSTGGMSYVGVTSTTTPIFDVGLRFLGNNQFAYGASCYHLIAQIFGFARNSDGSLTSLGNPFLHPPIPAAPAGEFFCPFLTATDSSNHVAVALQPIDASSLQSVGPYQLATYTADGSGNLSTLSTNSTMPAASVTNTSGSSLTSLSMSPTGQLLAVAGSGGLQVFHFNGASPITSYTALLTTEQVDQVFWDNKNHLYALSQSAGKLFVFTVTATSNIEAPQSPYNITSPAALVVLPE